MLLRRCSAVSLSSRALVLCAHPSGLYQLADLLASMPFLQHSLPTWQISCRSLWHRQQLEGLDSSNFMIISMMLISNRQSSLVYTHHSSSYLYSYTYRFQPMCFVSLASLLSRRGLSLGLDPVSDVWQGLYSGHRNDRHYGTHRR